jgi:hypothetical protein
MSTIVTRTTKGSALTWAEADANFNNLNADKLERSGGVIGGGFGYTTGAGGTIAQATSRTTGVTLSKLCGSITLFSTTTTAGQVTSFTVTNSLVAIGDVVSVSVRTGTGIYLCAVTVVAAGSFRISVHTPAAVGVAEAPVLNFAVIKAVTA